MRLRSLHPSRRSAPPLGLFKVHRGPGRQMPKILPRRRPHISDMCGLLPLASFRCAAHGRFGLGVAPAVARSGGTRGASSHCPSVLLRKVASCVVDESRGQVDSLELLLHHVACFDGRVLPKSLVRGELSERAKVLCVTDTTHKRHLGEHEHAFPLRSDGGRFFIKMSGNFLAVPSFPKREYLLVRAVEGKTAVDAGPFNSFRLGGGYFRANTSIGTHDGGEKKSSLWFVAYRIQGRTGVHGSTLRCGSIGSSAGDACTYLVRRDVSETGGRDSPQRLPRLFPFPHGLNGRL